MKIWIFNNYNVLPEQGGVNRHYYFAKELKALGHEPVVFVGSHLHNTNIQMIEGKELYSVDDSHEFPWVYVKTCKYENNKIKRVLSMFEYYKNAKKAAKHFGKPDVIIGSSAHPLAAVLAVKLGKKYHCKSIAEVRDLWPESIVVYGVAGKRNPVIALLRKLEKWIYTHADEVIFTMEGAYDYIVERGWEKQIPREKVHYVNNGVDIKFFDLCRQQYKFEDSDLYDDSTFKVIYTGAVRTANGPQLMIDTAEYIQPIAPDVKFLVFGYGQDIESLRRQCKEKNLTNIIFKGAVPKKMIPSILASSDLNILNYDPRTSQVYRFGSSQNKLFEYLASGKPVLSTIKIAYSIIKANECGIEAESSTPQAITDAILEIKSMTPEQIKIIQQNCRKTAEVFDFSNQTLKLLDVINHINVN